MNFERGLIKNVATSISKEELHQLPVGQFKGSIQLIESTIEVERVCSNLCYEPVLGFDTESNLRLKKEIQTMFRYYNWQHQAMLTFQADKTGLPETLIKVLSNPKILK